MPLSDDQPMLQTPYISLSEDDAKTMAHGLANGVTYKLIAVVERKDSDYRLVRVAFDRKMEESQPTEQSKSEAVKIRIPVVVSRTGDVSTGSAWVNGGKHGSEHDFAYDGFSDEAYKSGTAVVHVDAEIDVGKVFKHHVIQGEVSDA